MTRFLFVPFGAAAPDSAISCDGLVDGTSLHASHWAGTRTRHPIRSSPAEVAAALARNDPG